MRLGQLRRLSDGRCMVAKAARAVSPIERMRGLLGRPALNADEGLLIERCNLVHTLGMRYCLDLVFLDKHDRVCKLVGDVAPLRMAGSWRAAMTLELAPGELARQGWRLGDQLVWEDQLCA